MLNVAYVFSNAALTVGWLMRLYGKRHPEFHRFRRAAVLTTLIAQPVFVLFPCAPPRSLDGFVDTMSDVTGVDLDSGVVAQLYDPLAAMPSIHVAYAVVTAAGVAAASESLMLRAAAPLPAARGGGHLRDREPLRAGRGRRRGRRRHRPPPGALTGPAPTNGEPAQRAREAA